MKQCGWNVAEICLYFLNMAALASSASFGGRGKRDVLDGLIAFCCKMIWEFRVNGVDK